MAITPLFDFLKKAIQYAKVEAPELGADPASSREVGYHKRLVWLAAAFGVVGLFVAIFSWIPEMQREAGADKSGDRAMAYVITPIMGIIVGILFGFSLACLFAPSWFFRGPLGERLLGVIGTGSVVIARIVSLIICLLTAGLLAGVFIVGLF